MFTSRWPHLVPGDTNGETDVFVRDRKTDTTRRISVATGGAQGNRESVQPAISADGRYVAFTSGASNLVPGDTNRRLDVFVRDRVAHVTRRVSLATGGGQANSDSNLPAISANGRYVAFISTASDLVARDTNGQYDVFVRNRTKKVTRRVSVGTGEEQSDGDSFRVDISADGHYVVFTSYASNLVPSDTVDNNEDVFLRDRVAHRTRLVSRDRDGGVDATGSSKAGVVSGHGRFVAFESDASNLVNGDTNGRSDVFLRDMAKNITKRMSVGAGGAQGNQPSTEPDISANGRYVAFTSDASNLVTGDTGRSDVFVRDRATRETSRVSVTNAGAQANRGSYYPAVTAHGRYVAFTSTASNLVAGDTNGEPDVFVRDRGAE